MNDFYQILEVESNASDDQIKEQYRFLVQAWHPDKFSSLESKEKATEKIKQLNEAYNVLKNPIKREQYDRQRKSQYKYDHQKSEQAANIKTETERHQKEQDVVRKQEKKKEGTLKAKKKGRFVTYLGVFVSCFFMLVVYGFVKDTIILPLFFSRPNTVSTVVPTHKLPKPTPRPTVRVVTNPTPTCLKWDQVTSQMNGQTICVYGTVTDRLENWEAKQTFFYFGDHDRFFLTSLDRWTGIEGTCISITGKVQLNTYQTPYIKIEDKLLSCDSALVNSPPSNSQAIPRVTSTTIPSTTTSTDCVHWSNVSLQTVGKRVCIYGNILTQITNDKTHKTYFYFGEKNQFHIISTSDWTKLEGSCVKIIDLVQSNNNIPYMQVSDDIYQCDDWMNP